MPRLAIAPEFPRELSALAAPVRRDVVVAVRRFLTRGPSAPHPERVRSARDHRIATLRLADRHRGVVLRQRDVYWLLTVLPDAAAWSYAQRYRFGVNSAIGAIEVWDAEALNRVEPALRRSAAGSPDRLFSGICDADLLAIGIDLQLLPLIRQITTEAHLAALEPLLPPTQYAPLAVLARGGSLGAAWRELDACRAAPPPAGASARAGTAAPVDPDDLAGALLRSPDQAVFVTDRNSLDRVLMGPDWCSFLHPPQHRLAYTDHHTRPVLVVGGAGTGKSLVALHRAAHLARLNAGPVLLVTFSGRLSEELAARLDLLVNDEVLRKRVEVGNVDRLAHRIVAEAEGRQPSLVGAAELTALWREAASGRAGSGPGGQEPGNAYGPAFLLREWEQVVLAQNLRRLPEYLMAHRPGRSVDLSPEERQAVWRAIEHVVDRLRELGKRTLLQLAADASELLSRTTGDLLDNGGPRREPYRHIVVDEAQDLHPAQWRLLRAAVPPGPDDLFIVGDPHQRIFDTRVALTAVGIDAEQHRLRVSYRLSQEVLSWAVRLRGGGPADGLVEGVQELFGFQAVRNGPRPVILAYDTAEAELAGLVARVREWLADGVPAEEIGVAGRTLDLVRAARGALRKANHRVRVTTLHGMKGLEFRRVALIGVNAGVIPATDALTPAKEDPTARAHDLQRERGLLYVACTRAKELLYISHSGRASPFLPP